MNLNDFKEVSELVADVYICLSKTFDDNNQISMISHIEETLHISFMEYIENREMSRNFINQLAELSSHIKEDSVAMRLVFCITGVLNVLLPHYISLSKLEIESRIKNNADSIFRYVSNRLWNNKPSIKAIALVRKSAYYAEAQAKKISSPEIERQKAKKKEERFSILFPILFMIVPVLLILFVGYYWN